ncbi:helix-turn-helix domain-containing protein [Streptomyces sp. NPDC126497]|uniref:MarR family transcriptional regulator n=1 Tax=Streptomyces sp. NPDC126497 TaxID=3155313 RepID=UPI003333D7CD
MHAESTTANLLGAAALALSDVVVAEATRAANTGSSGAAALVVLSTDPGLSVTELGRRVGLSQSAAARMVGSLEEQGLVRKEAGWGGRGSAFGSVIGARRQHVPSSPAAATYCGRR